MILRKNLRRSPEYENWRRKVIKRDKGRCVLCGKRSSIVHHLIRYADIYSLRYSINNGCVLCYKCHKKITGHESCYIDMLRMRINENSNKNCRRRRN